MHTHEAIVWAAFLCVGSLGCGDVRSQTQADGGTDATPSSADGGTTNTDGGTTNEAPTASAVTISPIPPRKGMTLTCMYSYTDPENDPDQSTLRWLVNGSEVGTGPTLATGFAGGDTVACEVTPHDGQVAGPSVTATEQVFYGAISGAVFLDSDSDGVRDTAEAGIAGRTIYIDANDNGAMDTGEQSVTTDAAGAYEFPNVMPGTHKVAQLADGNWTQTYPTAGPSWSDNFSDASIDSSQWTTSGDGISEAGGVLTMNRNSPTDAITFLPKLSGSARIKFNIRNTQMHWKDMFHGFQLIGPCDTTRGIDGVSFGFSRYGNFYMGKSTCSGMSFTYPTSYAINQWYTFEAIIDDGQVRILVDGNELATAQVPYTDVVLSLPGYYSDGGAETNTISQVDNFSVETYEYRHTITLGDGTIVSAIDFGTN